MSLRASLGRLRSRLHRFWLVPALVSAAVAVLNRLYDDMAGLKIAGLLGIIVLTFVVALMVAPPASGSTKDRRIKRRQVRPKKERRPDRGTAWQRLMVFLVDGPVTLPVDDGVFKGRDKLLDEMVGRHDKHRARTPEKAAQRATSPVVLHIYGKPGVGKTATAVQLARRLAPRYPHGRLFVPMAGTGAARTPNEVLKQLLVDLRVPNGSIPATQPERVKLFRSLVAKKKYLFVFDSTHDAQQLISVLPADPASAVIVTSRYDLSKEPTFQALLTAPPWRLDVPDEDGALDIFRALSQTEDGVRPVHSLEVVNMCGRLPAAIRSAAERVQTDRTDICHLAGLLRPVRSRLAWLDRPGREVSPAIRTEFDQLLPDERKAFAMLSLVASETFTPWVVAPLMNVPIQEAENLFDRINKVQLVDSLGKDAATELGRFGLDPLASLFARERVEDLSPADRDDACRRLDLFYQDIVTSGLRKNGIALPTVDHTPDPAPEELGVRISDHRADSWLKAEHANLLRVMANAAGSDHSELTWRLAIWLGGCVPTHVAAAATSLAYARAVQSVTAMTPPADAIDIADVLLARGTFLAAIDRYQPALKHFRRAVEQLGPVHPGDPRSMRRKVIAYRSIGQALLQAASFRRAVEYLEEAMELAAAAADEDEQALIRILIAEAHHVDGAAASLDYRFSQQMTSLGSFRGMLTRAEAASRRREFEHAAGYLDIAMEAADGDLRRITTVRYRMARLHLNRCRAAAEGKDKAEARHQALLAVRRAAAALFDFNQMRDCLGSVRTRCLLASALLAANFPVEAEQVIRGAELDLDRIGPARDLLLSPVRARVNWVKGELLRNAGLADAADNLMMSAATDLARHSDWAHQGELLAALAVS